MALQNVKVNEQKVIGVDYEPIKDSSNVITSGAVYEKSVLTSQPIQDPQAEWEPSSAQEYIDEKIAEIDASIRELEGATEVQIGGGTPTDPDIRIYIDTSTDESVEVYTKAQADGQFVATVNMNTEPTESTLTYTSTDGTTKNFKVGDEVRVPDAEADNGYTFYKLYKLETVSDVTIATWDKLGAGGSANPKEIVNISLTQVGGNSADLTGASITITDDNSGDTLLTATWSGTMITTEIPMGTYYTISVSSVTGYLDCADKSYLAGFQTERNINFLYVAPGTYIEATDHTLYTSSTWASSGKTANAIVVITSTLKRRISLNAETKSIHSSNDSSITSYLPGEAEGQALTDYNGASNTDAIVNFNAANGTNTTTYAAPYCKNFTFPDGVTKGYLPAAGEYSIVVNNASAINTCLTAAGGTTFDNSKLHLSSSTTTESPWPIWRASLGSETLQISTTSIANAMPFHVFSAYE